MSVEYNYRHVYFSFILAVLLSLFFIIRAFWIYIVFIALLILIYKLVLINVFNQKLPLEGKAVLITGCDTGQYKI